MVWSGCESRADSEHGAHYRHDVGAIGHAHAARYCRHRIDGGHGGGRERADLLENQRGTKKGAPPQAAINAGFDRAFVTILDANITTLLVAIILYTIGTGPVKGFAITLSIGIMTSMFTAIMGTRAIINLLWVAAPFKALHRLAAIMTPIPFMKYRKVAAVVSIVPFLVSAWRSSN